MKRWLHFLMVFLLAFITLPSFSQKVWIVGAIPQQSARKLNKLWKPFLAYISAKTGQRFEFQASPNFKSFEQRCESALFDFVYLSPYHYTTYHDISQYNAIAKAKNKKIKGIIVVKKNSPFKNISDLNNLRLGFPSPTAFAASVLPRGYLKNQNISFDPVYSKTHDNVYYGVAQGYFPAGGGVIRTFNATSAESKNKLRVLWTSKGYTPHAIASHQRIPVKIIKIFQKALVSMSKDPNAKKLYQNMKIKYGFEIAKDSDWDDIRSLGVQVSPTK